MCIRDREVKFIHVQELVANWVRLHEYMREDAERLQFVEWVTLEGFVDDQVGELARLWRMAGLGEGKTSEARKAEAAKFIAASDEKPKKDFNKKYQDRWCEAVAARDSARMAAEMIVEKFGDRVKAIGLPYDLDWCKDWVPPSK